MIVPVDNTVASSTSKTLIIFGAGGHGKVVADAAYSSGAWKQIFATDDNSSKCRGELLKGVRLILPELAVRFGGICHIAIGNNEARQSEASRVALPIVSIIHSGSTIARSARLAQGCFVAANVVIGPQADIARCVIVNHGAVVDHECIVGSFCHIAPGAVLGGAVILGDRVLVGAGAVILPGVHVVDDAVIGAGAVVISSIVRSGTWVGVPAKRIL